MNNNRMIAVVIIVLVLLGIGGFYVLSQSGDQNNTNNTNTSTNTSLNPSPTTPTPTPTTTPPVVTTPTSTEGGDVTTPVTTTSNWKTYTHAKEYSLKYPPYLLLQTGIDLGGFFDIGSTHAKLRFPQDYFQKDNSNFIESHLVVSRDTIETNLLTGSQQCTSFSDVDNNMNDKAVRKIINGVNWYMQHVEEPAAGNRYYSDIYRTVRDNYCYEVALTVRTGVKENYEPPVTEFKKEKALDVLEKVLGTFTFAK